MNMNTTSAFVAIVGRPNVGKSSVLNRLLGQKIAIVSDKPQTTRTKITGVLTKGEAQYVFIDTPGLHKPRNTLGERMVKAVGDGMADVDVCLLVAEATAKVGPAEQELISRFARRKIPAVLALNKIDLLDSPDKMLSLIQEYSELYDFAAIVPVSAQTGDGLDALEKTFEQFLQPSPHYFDDDTLTDQPERLLAAEMIREKLLRSLSHEVPHGIAVDIEKFSEREDSDILDLSAVIYCERSSHKGIVIGKRGAMLKQIGSQARADLEAFFGVQVNLQLWVKVKEDWRNRAGSLHTLGLD